MKRSTANTIKEIEDKFPDMYDFSLWDSKHVGSTTPTKTGCKVCGHIFMPVPNDLIRNKHKCPTCSKINKKLKAINDFFIKSKLKHDDFYDYSLVNYVDSVTKVKIICPIHGEFEQRPSGHVGGKGCVKCAREAGAERCRIPFDNLIDRFNEVHNKKYDYSLIKKSDYKNQKSKLRIVCKEHGEFMQNAGAHLIGREGCPECKKIHIDRSDFLDSCRQTHNNYYDYTHTDYNGSSSMLTNIWCPEHGMFSQRADSHKGGNACWACYNSRSVSVIEQEIFELVSKYATDAIQTDRTVLMGKELDILIPSKSLAIEVCGIYWHTEYFGKMKNYHKDKYDKCKEKNIQLITIFEDEWNLCKNQVINKLKSLLGVDDRPIIYGRKTKIKIVDKNEKITFLNENHIQQDGRGSIVYGLYTSDDELVACTVFINNHNGVYYLNRYATSHRVIGGLSKLMNYFMKNNVWSEIISFADARWSNGNMYENTGWQLEKILPPDYSYYYKSKRYNKRNFRKKYLSKWFGENYDSSLTEYENCSINNAYRIWDCGKYKYILKNNTI